MEEARAAQVEEYAAIKEDNAIMKQEHARQLQEEQRRRNPVNEAGDTMGLYGISKKNAVARTRQFDKITRRRAESIGSKVSPAALLPPPTAHYRVLRRQL